MAPSIDWAAAERRLEAAILARLTELNPLRSIMPVLVDPGELVGGHTTAEAHWVARPAWVFGAPADYPSPFWLPSDGSAPTPPAPPALVTAQVSPFEVVVIAEFTGEGFADLRLLAGPPDLPVTERSPVVASEWLAYGLALEEQRALVAGSGGVSDPVVGLGSTAGFTTRAVGADTLVDAFVKAAADLRRIGRRPTAFLVGPSTEQALRLAKDSSGLPLFRPDAPLRIADLPVVTVYGIPAGASTVAYCGDWSATPILVRPIQADGELKPLEVRISPDFAFGSDKITIRLRERLTLAPLPGIGKTSVVQITGVNAP